jgi:hypothetical protein
MREITKVIKQQLPKKMKATYGFPCRTFSLMIGNMMITDEDAIQFMAVAKGTYLGYTISEIQIQVSGPSVSPNDPMNMNMPAIIIT